MKIQIQLEPSMLRRLDELEKQSGVSKSALLAELVARGMGDLEDFYLAAATMERVRTGKEKIFSTSEVRANLALKLSS